MATPHHHDPHCPSVPSSKVLTVESTNHLHHFVTHVLEEQTGFRDADRDAWVSGIESAMNDLARAVETGAWLSGIRRARVLERKRAELAAAAIRTREQEEKETEARNRVKSRAPAATDSAKPVKEAADHTPAEVKTETLHLHPRKPPDDDTNRNLRALQQLRNLANAPRTSSFDDPNRARYLLLTVAPPDAAPPRPPPPEIASAADAAVQRCIFSPGVYSLPAPDLFGEDPDDNCEAVVNSTLNGFREWDVNSLENHDNMELVGGTFLLGRVQSADEHASLVRVIRLSAYVLLSLLLEQHFLSGSSIELHYPKQAPAQLPLPSQTTVPIAHRNSSPEIQQEAKPRRRDLFRQSILSLLPKRLHRSMTVNTSTSDSRGVSLDISRSESDTSRTPTPRASLDLSLTSARRFSIFGESRAPPPSPVVPPSEPSPDLPFQSVLRCIEEGKARLSASPGLVISPPQLLVRLAESEKLNPARRLTGEERTGLTSILGWEGKKAAGRGNLTSIDGFLRQQQLSFLYSEHVNGPDRTSQATTDGTLNKPVGGEHKPHAHCGIRVRWVTYVYYASSSQDWSLGDMITSICTHAGELCTQPGCKSLQRQHERRWIHGGLRVIAQTEAQDPSSPSVHSDDIEMWQSCKICKKTTTRCQMSDGTYLFSFAKFLELLLYSSTICTLSYPLCTHTSPSSPSTSLPASRFNIIRHFSFKSHQVSFTLSPVDEIFDLRMPRLQFTKGGWMEKTPLATVSNTPIDDATLKTELRQEIKHWWQAVAEHLDKVEAVFADSEGPHYPKTLPRLPSAEDAWEDTEEEKLTPKGLRPVSLPPTAAHSTQPSCSSSLVTIRPSQSGSDPSHKTISSSDDLSDPDSPLRLLTNMRFAFQRAEQALYEQLYSTPNSALNNVRREFHSAALGASRRLAAWEAKHVSKEARPRLSADHEAIQEPQWWHAGYHAVPGGNVIVQEEDWGSIIAFTLSSIDYQRELANMINPRGPHSLPVPPPQPQCQPVVSRQNTASSLGLSTASGSTSSFKFFSLFHKPDPDREDSVWHEPETYSAVVSRKEHPRDPTALLSLRDVLRHKVPVEGSQGSQSAGLTSVSRLANNAAPPSAWAKPAVEVNLAAVDGQVTGMPEAVVTAGRILHELDGTSVVSSKSSSTDSAFVETNVHRGKASSVLSRISLETMGSPHPVPEDVPARIAERGHTEVFVGSRSRASTVSTTQDGSEPESAAHESTILSWTNSLTNAMRYMLKADIPSRPVTPALKNHHGLLFADPLTIDERPHIKYDWTIGKRLKFSCTVYYAKQFDALRRRCGVEDVFVRSMAKCEPWKAQGGKSRSNFWKTSDDRFIVKTLVNAWNVTDLQVLIDLAPSYFMHMGSTASRPSILTKLLGFYTVEIRHLETGTVQTKADLLVMENLFYGHKPTKTFDLKGIQGRKVKASSNTSASKTLFDSEWIEGQQRALTLVDPISKVIFQEAVRADCDFLERSNIMDYSLLLGVDEERKQVHCGLVDTIGSYTFAKTLEYKAKGLSKEGKDITVVPPHEYEERFVSAMESYFMACPDKWTRPVDETLLIHDPALLPSVL